MTTVRSTPPISLRFLAASSRWRREKQRTVRIAVHAELWTTPTDDRVPQAGIEPRRTQPTARLKVLMSHPMFAIILVSRSCTAGTTNGTGYKITLPHPASLNRVEPLTTYNEALWVTCGAHHRGEPYVVRDLLVPRDREAGVLIPVLQSHAPPRGQTKTGKIGHSGAKRTDGHWAVASTKGENKSEKKGVSRLSRERRQDDGSERGEGVLKCASFCFSSSGRVSAW